MAYYNGPYNIPEQYDSDYDSTWEDKKAESKGKRKKNAKDTQRKRAARDSQRYRNGYMENLMFYQNKKRFDPDGEYIEYIHEKWETDYDLLEKNHHFIQWLFPIQEQGVNRQASPLTPEERECMKEDSKVLERLMKSYKLMLGFYGIELTNEKTGEVAHAHNWKERFWNLNCNSHNNLRITRILKCLGEFGYEHFQAPLVKFFLEETLCKGKLLSVKQSVLDYFMFTVKNKEERRKLVHFAWVNYKPQDEFIWGPVEILREFDRTIKGSGHLTCDNAQPPKPHGDRELGNSSSVEIPGEPIHPEQGSSGGEVADPKKSKWLRYQYVLDFISNSLQKLLSPLFTLFSLWSKKNADKKKQSSEETLNLDVEHSDQSVRIHDFPAQSKNWSHEVTGHIGTPPIADIQDNIRNTEPEGSDIINKKALEEDNDTFERSRSSQGEQKQRAQMTKFEEAPPGISKEKVDESFSETSRHGVGQVQYFGSVMDSDTVAHFAFEQNNQAAQGDQNTFEGTEKRNITKESKERENQESQGNIDGADDDQNTRSGGIPTGDDPKSQQEPTGEQITNEKSNDGKADNEQEDHSKDESAELGFPEKEEDLDVAKQPERHEGQKKGEMNLIEAITSQRMDIRAPDDGGNREDSGADNTEIPVGKADRSQNTENREDVEAGTGVHIAGGGTDDDNSRDCGIEKWCREECGADNKEIPVDKDDITQNSEDGKAEPGVQIGGGGKDDNSRDSGTEEVCSSEDRAGSAEAQEVDDVRASNSAEEIC